MKKRKTGIIWTLVLLLGFITGITIFLPQYEEYKKYVHFKDESLQEIMQASSDWSQYFDLRSGKVSVKPVSYTHLDVYKRQVEVTNMYEKPLLSRLRDSDRQHF